MSQLYDWLVQISDLPNALQKRMDNLQAHLSYNKPQIEAGTLVFSGPTLSSQPKSNEIPPMTGTVMLLRASTEEEAWKLVKENPYATTGIWDMDKAVVTPFRCVVRKGM